MNIAGLDLLFLEVNNMDKSPAVLCGPAWLPGPRNNPDAELRCAILRAGKLKITCATVETMLRRGRG